MMNVMYHYDLMKTGDLQIVYRHTYINAIVQTIYCEVEPSKPAFHKTTASIPTARHHATAVGR
jgi:hypothetical protein